MVGLGTRSTIERVEIGNSRPKVARASALPDRQRRASRFAGRKDGRYLEITNRHTQTPADGGAGRPRSREGLDDPGPSHRRGLSAGGVSPHEQVKCPRNRWGDGTDLCRTPRREPARLAGASTQWTLSGSARGARLDREGRGGPAPDR